MRDAAQPLSIEGLRQRWGRFALDVRLALEPGEYLAILGPSGCGKSLLLGTIAGLHPAAAGRVLLGEDDLLALPIERREVALVFQHLSLFPHLDLVDNIAFGLRARRVDRRTRQQRVDELVVALGLQQLRDRPVSALSGGESQRVAIARALAPRPRLLLLDEPLSLVDHNARIELQQLLRRVHEDQGLTTIHVTHNREEARAQGDRCAVMLGGRIVQIGPYAELERQPDCVFVARFLGVDQRPPTRDDCSEICLAGSGRCDRRHR